MSAARSIASNVRIVTALGALWLASLTARASEPPPASVAEVAWRPLIAHSWSLEAGKEILHACGAVTLERETYLRAIRTVDAPGTHHWMLVVLRPGQDPCDDDVIRGTGLFFVSGVSSPPFMLPDGVAFHVPAGGRIGYQLHVLNTTDLPIVGAVSKVEVRATTREAVRETAEIFNAGGVPILPPMKRTVTRGTCTIKAPQTLFALFPHMHKLGVHFRTTLITGGKEQVIFDGPFRFDEQPYVAIDPPVALAVGDQVRTECTYANTTNKVVTLGDSSNDEMCFSFLFRHPTIDDDAFCMF